jgi:hypothetical protein
LNDPLWFTIYIAIHLFVFTITQLIIFKNHDLLSMFGFRLAYYMIWHIVWGYLRLDLLF